MKQSQMPDWEFDDEFDGGDETCGRVIINLYLYIRDQKPGRRILVVSRDPGAPVEFPAWCRMTKNKLIKMARERKVLDSIVFTGFADYEEVPTLLKALDVGVYFPHTNQPWGLPLAHNRNYPDNAHHQ